MKKPNLWLNTVILSIINLCVATAQLPSFLIKTDSSEITSIDLEEVIVSSWRENYKLKELPGSVTLISGNKVSEGEMQSIKDLTSRVPNFFMPDYGSKLTSPVYIRGIGSRIDSPSAGLYVDNVPYFDKAAFDFDLFDIESIEVLRGPQGTLYGRNTIAGLVNISTRSPLHHQGTHLRFSGGNYGHMAGKISHYHKLNEATAFSFAGNFMRRNGFHTNEYYNQAVDDIISYGARARIVQMLSPKLSLEIVAGFEKLDQGGYPYAIFNDSLDRAEAINYNELSSFKRDMLSGAFTLGYSGNNLNLHYTAGFQYFESLQAIDQDFTPASMFFVTQDQKQQLFSQEIIMKSGDDSRYKHTSGIFWFRQLLDKDVMAHYGPDAVPVYNLPGVMVLHREYVNPTTGGALFHQSALDNLLIENLSVSAGIRVDYEKALLDHSYYRIMGESTTTLFEFDSELEFFEFLPKLALRYSFLPEKWTYLSVARGYKTGGFNTSFEREEDRSYLPEYTWNYEVGTKMKWSSLLSAELALFYIDWKDQQIYQPIPSGRGSMLKNAGRSFSRGAELSLSARTLSGYDFTIDYGFTDARFVSHIVDSLTNYSGNRVPYVPLHTFSLGAGRVFELTSKWADSFAVRLNHLYTGRHYWNEGNTYYQDGYGILNMKLSVYKKIFSLELWAKNLLQKSYHSFYFTALGNNYVQLGKPFTFGVNLALNF